MKIADAFVASAGLFIVFRFILLPLAKKSWQATHDIDEKRKKGFWIVVLEEGGHIALVAAVTFAALALLLLYTNAAGGDTAQRLGHALDTLARLRQPVVFFKDVWSSSLLFFSLLVFVFLWWRTGRRHYNEKFGFLLTKEIARLQSQLREDPEKWRELQPTPSMEAIRQKIRKVEARMASLPEEEWHSEQAKDLNTARQHLAEFYLQLDFERRIDFPWDMPMPEATTPWSRSRNIFLSRGFLSDMKKTGKALKYAVLALTFASLVGIEGFSLGPAIDQKIVKLDELRVNKSLEESDRERKEREKSGGSPQEDPPPTPQQQEALRAFAQQAIHSFAHNPVWPQGPKDPAGGAKAGREAVRFAVLEQSEKSSGPRKGPPPADSVQEAALYDFSEKASQPTKVDAAVAAVQGDLSRIRGPTRNKFFAALGKWRASYQEPLDAGELQASLTESMLGAILPGAPEGAEVPLQIREALTEGLKTSAGNALGIFRNRLVLSIYNGDDPAAILASFREASPQFSYMTARNSETIAQKLSIFSEKAGAGDDFVVRTDQSIAKLTSVGQKQNDVLAILKEMPAEYRKGHEDALANLLSDFNAEFPLPRTTVSQFNREGLLSAWGIANPNDAAIRSTRAFDFDQLRSYSRVGGILFGRPPASGQAQVSGFDWQSENGGLAILLRAQDGSSAVKLGTFSPYLIRQALAYASDGRLTVVTLLNAEEIGRKQVMVHPAFQDTGLGCRLLAADQWIFHYTDPRPKDRNSTEFRRLINRYEAESELYKDGWQALKDPDSKVQKSDIQQWTSYLPQPDTSTPWEKAEGVDPRLLRLCLSCATTESSDFAACVRRSGDRAAWKADVLKAKPAFGFVSQVQEASFSLDDGLQFLQGRAPSPADAPPLELTIQMTINDQHTWRFDGFAEHGPKTVLSGLLADRKTNELEELQDLARLQRLFRAALGGQLGPRFPLAKLVQLARVSRDLDNQPRVLTPRWFAEPAYRPAEKDVAGILALMITAGKSLPAPMAAATLPLMQKCHDALGAAHAEGNQNLSSSCDWAKMMQSVVPECRRVFLENEEKANTSVACQIVDVALYGRDYLGPIHRLRGALEGAVDAESPETLAARCPRVPEWRMQK